MLGSDDRDDSLFHDVRWENPVRNPPIKVSGRVDDRIERS